MKTVDILHVWLGGTALQYNNFRIFLGHTVVYNIYVYRCPEELSLFLLQRLNAESISDLYCCSQTSPLQGFSQGYVLKTAM